MTENPPELTVITTHVNADFDAMASMLAAQKLYPEAVVVFPGSQEKNLRNFFVQSMVYLFNMADIKNIDFSAVTRLVLVDTRNIARIGRFSSLVEQGNVEIHIYDHHPAGSNDIAGHVEIIRPAGATVSILTKIIKDRHLVVTSDEATIMLLGIYEDTGSFTFTSTTESDFEAAAYLTGLGANIEVISGIIAREISSEQVGILNDMLQAATPYRIRGIDVVVTSITSENYIHDFAYLVHKMVKMENYDAVFALARMANKVYIVARSRNSDVDVGAVLSQFGGGGHAYAAAATVKDNTLAHTEQKLLDVLHKTIRSSFRARDLMSSPPIAVRPEISCEEARKYLTRYNVNALLILEKKDDRDILSGCITRQIISKAVYLQLHDSPVQDYMTTDIGFVDPDAELPEIQEKIIGSKQRILPVMENHLVIGVITRTDLLNSLVQQIRLNGQNMPDPHKEEINFRSRNVISLMKERVSPLLLETLRTIGEIADQLGYGAYVVGGFVRDLFLQRENEDLDIVVEGDGMALARAYGEKTGARVHTHKKFYTAVIIFQDGSKIDVATARMEHYRFPADLPSVEMSSIKLDLFRRDFTVNTLAIQLNSRRFGMMIDFFAAQKDVKEKVIRILHNLSFVEDPTRVYRAIRFEQRFGFTIGKLTTGLLKNVVQTDFFKTLSGRRVFNEIRQILEEENPEPAITRLHDFGLLTIIHPDLKSEKKNCNLLHAVKKVLDWHDLQFLGDPCLRWVVYLCVLTRSCDREGVETVCEKLEIAPRYRRVFCVDRHEADRCLYRIVRIKNMTNSRLYALLCGYRIELLLYMMAATERECVKKRISDYLTKLRTIQPSIAGKDLKRMGLVPGPVYREILAAVRDAKLDGKLQTRNDELNFARNYMS